MLLAWAPGPGATFFGFSERGFFAHGLGLTALLVLAGLAVGVGWWCRWAAPGYLFGLFCRV